MSASAQAPPSIAQQGVMVAPPVPACPAGWSTAPPDFVGVGAQRSGTTRWFDLIVEHPQIQAPPATRKELHYFDRFHAGGFTAADAAGYSDYFPRPRVASTVDGAPSTADAGSPTAGGSPMAGGAPMLTGEWTPVYLAAPWVPAMLAAAAPNTKLLVTLRDPIERYLSGLQRHHRTARATDTPLNAMAPLEAFMRGFYHAQLTRLLAHFERSQILVLQYERCVREPLVELQRTLAFLGVKDTGFTPNLDAHPNRQPEKPELHPDARRALTEAYAPDVAELSRCFAEIDIALWPNFAQS